MSDHVPVIDIPNTDTETEVPPYDTFATSFENTFQDISGYGNGRLWEIDDGSETTDELGHEALVVEAQAADEPGHEAPAAVEPIQTDSIASTHSTQPSREIRIVYTRRKRKPETGLSSSLQGSMSAMRELLQSMMGQLTFLREDKRAEMKKKLDAESQHVEAAEASLVAAQQQVVTMGENVEATVALTTTSLMMFAVMIRAGGIT
ncbi:hypothetical protein L1987_48454 [Smallanthus sonchifolius]|uniref:Uncharacterized protein n=1 Tax=Smallanthus sonchifolius TaxID=185202 RepID=A0ACB9FSW5_9ASTR|nr:hypothetical protein L1987_48454 [Smallanthus sonchifolius]